MRVRVYVNVCFGVFFLKHKTAYEMRSSDWSSDLCSSDLSLGRGQHRRAAAGPLRRGAAFGIGDIAGGLHEGCELVIRHFVRLHGETVDMQRDLGPFLGIARRGTLDEAPRGNRYEAADALRRNTAGDLVAAAAARRHERRGSEGERKSTRLNSSH